MELCFFCGKSSEGGNDLKDDLRICPTCIKKQIDPLIEIVRRSRENGIDQPVPSQPPAPVAVIASS